MNKDKLIREYHGNDPLIPPWVIERIVVPRPKRARLLQWLKKSAKKEK